MSLRLKTASGIGWTSIQQLSIAIIRFIIQIILARIIAPEQFGFIGMIVIFYAIGMTLIDSGLAQSLLRTVDPDDDDYSSVFYMNIGTATTIYIALYFLAPYISFFYDEPILKLLIRIYSFIIILNALYIVQVTRLSKALDFRSQTLIEVPSIIISGLVGIIMGYLGYGVWALVWMQIIQSTLTCIQYWIRGNWYPLFRFRKEKWKVHFNFGYKLLLSGLLDSTYNNVYTLIIGKLYAPAQVGYYTRAITLRNTPLIIITSSINKVLYTVLSEIRNEPKRLLLVYRKILKTILLVMSFTMGIGIVFAKPLIVLLLTDKWIAAVPYFQLLCIGGIIFPLHVYYLNSLKVTGRSDLFLKAEITKKILGVVILIFTVPYGIIAIIIGQVLSSFLSLFVNQFFARKVLDYPFWIQNKDAFRIILPSFTIIASIYFLINYLDDFTSFFVIVFLFIIYSFLFLTLHWTINKESFDEIFYLIKKIKTKK